MLISDLPDELERRTGEDFTAGTTPEEVENLTKAFYAGAASMSCNLLLCDLAASPEAEELFDALAKQITEFRTRND